MSETRQRILPLGVKSQARLEDFYPHPNAEALRAVFNLVTERERQSFCLYLYGPAGVGKSHLLLGAASAVAGWAPYIDCGDITNPFNTIMDPAMFSSLAGAPLLCLDNVESWAGQRDKETFFFDLYNERMGCGRPLLLAGRQAAQLTDWVLPDWASRVSAGLQYALRFPGDAEKRIILQEMAQRRGLQIGVDAALYLLRHYPRDLGALDHMLSVLDTRSWEQQREVTIPFIRLCLAAENLR